METILPYNQYILIYRSSFITFFTFLYALYMKLYLISIFPGSIFLTSINYWKKPMYSYRRTLDIVVVTTSISCQHYLAYNSQYQEIYYFLFLIGQILYLLGKYYYNKKEYLISTYLHISFQAISNFATVILCSGDIVYYNTISKYSLNE